jgi:hypothetical protein
MSRLRPGVNRLLRLRMNRLWRGRPGLIVWSFVMLGKTREREGKTGQQRCPENPFRDVFSLPHSGACFLYFTSRNSLFVDFSDKLIDTVQKSLAVLYDSKFLCCFRGVTDSPQRCAALPNHPAVRNQNKSRDSCPGIVNRSLPCRERPYPPPPRYWNDRFRLPW